MSVHIDFIKAWLNEYLQNGEYSIKKNPFRKVVTSRNHFFQYLLQARWLQKVQDVYFILAGRWQHYEYETATKSVNKFQRTAGLFDWVTLFIPMLLDIGLKKFYAPAIKYLYSIMDTLFNEKSINTNEERIAYIKSLAKPLFYLCLFGLPSIFLMPIAVLNNVTKLVIKTLALAITAVVACILIFVQLPIIFLKTRDKITDIRKLSFDQLRVSLVDFEDRKMSYSLEHKHFPQNRLDRRNYHLDLDVNQQQKCVLRITDKKSRSWNDAKVTYLKATKKTYFSLWYSSKAKPYKSYDIEVTPQQLKGFFDHNILGIDRKCKWPEEILGPKSNINV